MELREKFFLAEGVSQTMASFTAKSPVKSPPSSHSGTAKTSSTTSGPIMKVCVKKDNYFVIIEAVECELGLTEFTDLHCTCVHFVV